MTSVIPARLTSGRRGLDSDILHISYKCVWFKFDFNSTYVESKYTEKALVFIDTIAMVLRIYWKSQSFSEKFFDRMERIVKEYNLIIIFYFN